MSKMCNLCGQKYDGTGPAYVCRQCVADAKLGRMVRAMPRQQHLIHQEKCWACFQDDFGYQRGIGSGQTPEEALERAGVKG